jgi:trigger factor
MQVTQESANGLERKIVVEVPAETIDDAVNKKLQSIAKTARINGFRPGKVPMKVIRKRYGGHVRQEVLGDVINESYRDALEQVDLKPAGMPSIEPVVDEAENSEPAEGFRYRATFEVFPEIQVASLDGKSIEKKVAQVEETDLDEMIETLRKQRVNWVEVDRAAKTDDQVTMDFAGSIDGEEFDGGSAKEAPLVLGSGSMIPGFEEQLEGVSKGDSKTITVNFPEDYRATHLAGKEAQFEITVHAVKESELPEVNDEFAKDFGVEEGGVETLRSDIRKNMERELTQSLDNLNKQAVMDVLLESNDFDVPGSMVKDEIGRLRQQITSQMQGQGGTETPELADELFQEDAQRRVKLGLLISEIIKQNEIKVDPDKVKEAIDTIASSYEDPKQVVDYYYGNAEYLQNVEGMVLEQQVTDWAMENATVVDKSLTFKEVMNPEQSGEVGDTTSA